MIFLPLTLKRLKSLNNLRNNINNKESNLIIPYYFKNTKYFDYKSKLTLYDYFTKQSEYNNLLIKTKKTNNKMSIDPILLMDKGNRNNWVESQYLNMSMDTNILKLFNRDKEEYLGKSIIKDKILVNLKRDIIDYPSSNKLTGKKGIINIKNEEKQKKIIGKYLTSLKTNSIYSYLKEPFYFFTSRYIEKSQPGQIKHWRSSVFNFYDKAKWGDNLFYDSYATYIIEQFFRIKTVKKKWILFNKLKIGYNVYPTVSLMNSLNELMDFMDNRLMVYKNESNLISSIILKFKWFKKQIKNSVVLVYLLRYKTIKFLSHYSPFGKLRYKKDKRKIWISKPLFKHTPFNVIIDLYIYNAKDKLTKKVLKNLILRRSMYKYMYSMYINYSQKIKETISRPRFFYINIIEPKTINYYNTIMNSYEKLLLKKSKWNIIEGYLSLFGLRRFSAHKNETSRFYSKWILNNKLKELNREELSIYNINKNLVVKGKRENLLKPRIEVINKKFQKKKGGGTSLLFKKYLEELDQKSNEGINVESLTLWAKKGLGDVNPKIYKKRSNKVFGLDKFSLKEYKKKFLYMNKGKKRKISPKIWEKKLLEYYTFTKKLKINPIKNQKIFDRINKNKMNQKMKEDIYTSDIKIIDRNILSNKESRIPKKIHIDKDKSMYKSGKFISDSEFNDIYIKDRIEFNIKRKNIVKSLFITFYNKNIRYIGKEIKSLMNDIENLLFTNNRVEKWSIGTNFYIGKNKNFFYQRWSEKKWGELTQTLNHFNEWNRENKNTLSKSQRNKFSLLMINRLNKFWDKNKENPLIPNLNINLLNELVKNYIHKSNIWNVMYSLFYLQSEFYKIYRDIIVKDFTHLSFKTKDNYDLKLKDTYCQTHNNSSYKKRVLLFDNKINENRVNKLDIHIWPSYTNIINKRENIFNFKFMGYMENLFTPYYRYMIPLLIYNLSSYFLDYLGHKNKSYHDNKSSIYFMRIFHFILVKTLLNLMRYNYRSLSAIKPKYYYLNKLRVNFIEFIQLHTSYWLVGLKHLRNYNSTQRTETGDLWFKFEKLNTYQLKKMRNNAELESKRKILVPFVLYLEDLLYSVYGKWVIIRLWPIRYIYLSSYMLAKRVLFMMLWKSWGIGGMKPRWVNFHSITVRVMNVIRLIQVQRAYKYYKLNKNRWPKLLINSLNTENSSHSLSYRELEFYDRKMDRSLSLNYYDYPKSNLTSYNYEYLKNYYLASLFPNNKDYYNKKTHSVLIANSTITSYHYAYYWLRPLNSYIRNLTLKNSDITGVKFWLTGRGGTVLTNFRHMYFKYVYGTWYGTRQKTINLDKPKTVHVSFLRGYINPDIQTSLAVGGTINGCLSVRIAIHSGFSSDLHELILYLNRLKNLYYGLIHYKYKVPSSFNLLKYYKSKNTLSVIDKFFIDDSQLEDQLWIHKKKRY
jgi:hypothetical protein